MKTLKFILLALVLASALAFVIGQTGCSSTGNKLDPGGAYAPTNGPVQVQPDYAFFVVDSAFDLAYSTVNAAFQFEYDNRALLWKASPNIKHALDQIRPKAVDVRNRYIAARTAYMANPVPAGLSQLQSILAEIQSLATAAAAALPKGTQ